MPSIHSDGSSIEIERDSEGRVEQIRNSAGGTVRYQYSRRAGTSGGDLVGVVDLTGGYTQFLYENALFPHQLTAIIDRRGNRVAALDYTPEGRLVGLCDAEENCAESEYDLGNREWLQTDATRVPTRYEYNDRGDVTAEIDAFGHRKEFSYDAYGRLLTETDALGNVTRFTRDRGGRVLTETRPFSPGEDPADFTTTTTYNDSARRTSVTFASGGSYQWDYDRTGEPVRMRDSEGSVIYERTYNPFSRVPSLLNETNRFGTRSFSYSQSSLVPNIIFEADGSRTEQILDGNHQVIAWRNRVGQEMRFSYDDAQRPLTADYDNGITLEYEYGDEEDWVVLRGPTIGTYRREFSSTGRLVGWTLPSGDHYARSYDGAGRVKTETDELGNITRYAYDAAGRLESISEEATSGVTLFEYDAAGNLTRQVDSEGGETVYTYEDGELVAMRDANGETWLQESSPDAFTLTDPLGRDTVRLLSPLGLSEGVRRPGGRETRTEYNGSAQADEHARFPSREVDAENRTRVFQYGSRSELTGASIIGRSDLWQFEYSLTGRGQVRLDDAPDEPILDLPGRRIDPFSYEVSSTSFREPGPIGSEQFLGHRISSVTAPSGDRTQWEFNAQGHISRMVLPWGAEETTQFGDDGEPETRTLADGTVLSFTHDPHGRETSRSSSTGFNRSSVYGPGDRLESMTGPTGVIQYGYDVAGRLASIDTPAGGGLRSAVEYEYDSLGRTTAVEVVAGSQTFRTTYAYDGEGNLTSMTDVETGGVTSWVYDEVGRLRSRVAPNGVTTRWTYDGSDRVESVVHQNIDDGTV